MSLSQLLKTYESAKKQREKNTQTIRAQIQQCIEEETITALKIQNYKVNQIHKNQQAIESKLKKQQQYLNEFRYNQQIWVNLYDQLNRSLMQAGDLNHYAGYVEAQLKQLIGEGSLAQFLAQTDKEEMPSPKKETDQCQTQLEDSAKKEIEKSLVKEQRKEEVNKTEIQKSQNHSKSEEQREDKKERLEQIIET